MSAGGTVVIGVGNEFRHDDGFGPAVVEALRRRDLPGVRFAVTDGEPGHLLDLWAGTDLAVVVDAALAAPPCPGRIHRLTHVSGGAAGPGSSHGLGLGDAVELGAVLGRLPGRLVVYAVEPADLSLGPGLSPAVRQAVEAVTEAVAAEVGAGAPAVGR
jgi:hydrogenase maturation protease